MRKLPFPSEEIIPNRQIKNLIKVKTIKYPFKSIKESEDFYQKIIEEEMILSNDYNFENIQKLLNLYIKGINYYQNTLGHKEIDYFQEKINSLLNNPKARNILNKEKTKIEMNLDKSDSNFSLKEKSDLQLNKYMTKKNNNMNFNLLRSKTYKDSVALNRSKLNFLNRSIKQGMQEKEYQKKKIVEINTEFSDIKNQLNKTTLFLEDEIQKQSDNFKEKLLKKKTLVQKENKRKQNIIEQELNIIKEEKINENNNDENVQNIIKNNSNDLKLKSKEEINKMFEEYNKTICGLYFLNTLKNISELVNKNISSNMKIIEEYQNNINELLKMQMDGNVKISDDDIDSLKEEQELESQKNNDLYEKYIEEEISNFKIYGYSHSSPNELGMLKGKIKNEIYNDIYNILDNK
jgi:hypothetical protein